MPVSTAASITNGSLTTVFNENHENLHHVEFEAPLSAETDLEQRLQLAQSRAQNGRFSIDLSLELERQLNMDSPPATPSCNVTTHSVNAVAPNKDVHPPQHHGKPDPDVLAHIITHMRKSLVEMTKERDELLGMLGEASNQHANIKDALELMTEKATSAEEELDVAKKKMREDEEQIVLLRAKVEESRRGLMRLQTESRRQSGVPIDSSRNSSLTLSAFGSSPPSKRASFTPLTGRSNHRRISSVSDANLTHTPTPDPSQSPQAQVFSTLSPESHVFNVPNSSRRISGVFGHQLPAGIDLSMTNVAEPPQVAASDATTAVNSEELETLRKKLQSVEAELMTMRHDLIEANEAREASETCVRALREFIADNDIGAVVGGDASSSSSVQMKLPPPPTMTTNEEEQDRGKINGGWGFKLWGVDSPLKSNMSLSASMGTPSPMGPINSHSTLPPPVTAAAPLSRKLGGFFSSRSSVSSSSSQQRHVPPLQTNVAVPLRDSSYSFSDTSSVAEPISPGSDIHGLGMGPVSYFPEVKGGYGSIVVKDVTNLERVHTHALSVEDKDGIVRYELPVTLSSSGSVDLDGLR